jgi:predicted transcriptional regulator
MEILTILWEIGPTEFGQIRSALQQKRSVASTTVATMLKVMLGKDLVKRRDSPGGYLWSASWLTASSTDQPSASWLTYSKKAISTSAIAARFAVYWKSMTVWPTDERGRSNDGLSVDSCSALECGGVDDVAPALGRSLDRLTGGAWALVAPLRQARGSLRFRPDLSGGPGHFAGRDPRVAGRDVVATGRLAAGLARGFKRTNRQASFRQAGGTP